MVIALDDGRGRLAARSRVERTSTQVVRLKRSFGSIGAPARNTTATDVSASAMPATKGAGRTPLARGATAGLAPKLSGACSKSPPEAFAGVDIQSAGIA